MAFPPSPGELICCSLPSPAPSTASKISYHTLPQPRSSGPLRPGSRSESNLIAYLDDQLLQVFRKYAKKYYDGGYTTIKAVVEDLERLIDIIWVSSTPTLQTHYLLQMANSFNDYLASFPPQPKPTLRLLDTLDRCFYVLITGSSGDLTTTFPSAFSNYKMNMTEKVRLKSVMERTRLHIIKLVEGDMLAPDLATESVPDVGDRIDVDMDVEVGDKKIIDGYNSEDEEWEIELSKVYARSLVQIGEGLRKE